MARGDVMQKKGLLIMNLGSPESLTVPAIRAFLRDFLSDPYVVQLPRILWLPILYGLILTRRPKKLLPAYAEIWQQGQSPLLRYSQSLADKIQQKLHDKYVVHLAMRYGRPDVKTALAAFQAQGIDEITLLSLYPQYSRTTTQTNIEYVKRLALPGQRIDAIKDYHDHPAYIEALAQQINLAWQEKPRAEQFLFSFHGLPKSSIAQGDPYYYQCLKTAELLAAALRLSASDYRVSFQSRVGRAEWLTPYTDQTIVEMAQKGVQSLDVFCPGFSIDCLETLEEIAIQNRDGFLDNGGQDFRYIAALNDRDQHVDMLAAIIKERQ